MKCTGIYWTGAAQRALRKMRDNELIGTVKDMLQFKAKLYLTIFLATIGFLSQGQSIVGLTGGYYSSSYYDYSEQTNHWGTYHSPSSYCITAFIKQRNHESINIGEEVSFVSKVLDLNATYMG